MSYLTKSAVLSNPELPLWIAHAVASCIGNSEMPRLNIEMSATLARGFTLIETNKKNNFINLTKANFEQYYPSRFRAGVDRILRLSHDTKPAAKKSLLQEVLSFLEEDRESAKEEFEQSATEIIDILREIEERLFPTSQSQF